MSQRIAALAWLIAFLLAAAARAQTSLNGIVEIVPTARHEPATWRYSLERPARSDWASPSFDDSGWQLGRGGFGTPGTPTIIVNTRWATPDIWMRREVTLPATLPSSAPLQLIVFHDEDVEIYLNGVLAARETGFVQDYEPLDVLPGARTLLKPGAKLVIATHCRQTVGGQGIDVGLGIVGPDFLAARRKQRYRDFALSNAGDATAGRKLFLDEQRLACSRCHSTDGTAARAGPDLFAIGDKYPRAELIDAILHPSASIAVGYSTTIVTTKSGDALVGVLKEATDDHVGLMSGDGKLQRIAAAEIRSRGTQDLSLMPDDQEAAFSVQEFANVIAYLASLRLPEIADAGRAGMPSGIPELNPPVALVPIHSAENHFDHPCWVGQIPGEPGKFLICDHESGRVWRLVTGASEAKTLWGDFRDEIRPGPATGLLGLAFHPRFRENRKYYIQHQIVVGGRIYARVSEKTAAPDMTHDAGQPSHTIIEFPCSTDVHSGGGIQFGPDGYLYIGMGDTGPQGDPEGHAQDLGTMLGKMLRIDIDHEENGKPYAVPQDNPFQSRADARAEIWACGLREPWRFSFDPVTSDLWVGDVGQDRIEEVDIVRRGENYGWNVYEGFDLFSTRRRTQGAAYVPPVFAYNRHFGNSITGGYVYRGSRESPFYGVYVCADFTSKRVWGLKQSDRKLTAIWQLCTSPQEVSSFGCDEAGELYLVGYQGTIYRLDFGTATPGPTAAAK